MVSEVCNVYPIYLIPNDTPIERNLVDRFKTNSLFDLQKAFVDREKKTSIRMAYGWNERGNSPRIDAKIINWESWRELFWTLTVATN